MSRAMRANEKAQMKQHKMCVHHLIHSPEHLSEPRHLPRSHGVCQYLSAPAAGPPQLLQHVFQVKGELASKYVDWLQNISSINGHMENQCSKPALHLKKKCIL